MDGGRFVLTVTSILNNAKESLYLQWNQQSKTH